MRSCSCANSGEGSGEVKKFSPLKKGFLREYASDDFF